MNVVGHNIANVNTIGFKSQRMDFQDIFYNNTFSAAGLEQIGLGARIGCVLTDFSQGSFEQTGMSTDLAIQGKGWFQVRVPNQDTVYYTRAGDFFFNKEGELTSPHGYVLQGWEVPVNTGGPIIATGSAPQSTKISPILGSGVPKDIKLETWTVLPKETDRITTYVNLSASSTDHSIWDANPFAALFNTWNGQLVDPATNLPIDRYGAPYLAEDAFAYQSSIKIYDDAGVAHTATIYFDKVDKDWNSQGTTYYDGGKPSQTMWEYIVTIDPAEDMRMFWDPNSIDPITGLLGTAKSMQTTKMAGILMTGTMTYGSNGDLVDLSSYTLMGGITAVSKADGSGNVTLDPTGHYVAVWTNPLDPTDTQTYNAGDLIPATRINDTAFYPVVNTVQSYITTDPATSTTLVETGTSPAPDVSTAATAGIGTYTVNPGYRIIIPNPPGSGTTYEAGDVITNPTDVALLWDMGGGGGDIYCYEIVMQEQVKTGYQIIGTDNSPYAAGALLPSGVTALSAERLASETENMLLSWYPSAVSNNGLPLMVADFTAVEQAYTVGSPLGKDHLIEMDFGITVPHLANPWKNDLPLGAFRTNGGPAADGIPDPMDPTTWANAGGLAGIRGTAIIAADHCRLTGAASSATMLSRQNGYTYGNLMDIVFDQRGVMSGIYSNGVTLPLYQVVLYDFVAPQHLRFEGGNLVSQTMASGEPSWGAAGVNGFGTVNSYMIEQSNVDLAKEMVHMITTQRGFQANSKVITSVDTMLEVVVNMKR